MAVTTMVEDTKSRREAEQGRLISLTEGKATGSWQWHKLIEIFHYQKVKVIDKSQPDFSQSYRAKK